MATITDNMTVTELARVTGKSRPTVYKWLTLYESGDRADLPRAVESLFDLIANGGTKREIYQFCEDRFLGSEGDDELREIIELLTVNKDKLDLEKIKQFITEELKNESENK